MRRPVSAKSPGPRDGDEYGHCSRQKSGRRKTRPARRVNDWRTVPKVPHGIRQAELAEKTWRNYESLFGYLHSWELRKISSIVSTDALTLHAHLGNTSGKVQANRVVELLCAMFNRARKDWEYEGNNPATGIAFKERKRKRFIEGSELPAFFKALAEESNVTIRDYVLISLLTGARRSNVEAMCWGEINWRTAVWTIPAAKAKSDEDLTVVLTPVVINILEYRRASSLSPWVFPGGGKTGHLVEPKSCWKRILQRAGLTNLRLHDLRRTLGKLAGRDRSESADHREEPWTRKFRSHASLRATESRSRARECEPCPAGHVAGRRPAAHFGR